MIEHINFIDAYADQIKALLDLMQMANNSVDIKSINTASEMCATMFDELLDEVVAIETEWRDGLERKA